MSEPLSTDHVVELSGWLQQELERLPPWPRVLLEESQREPSTQALVEALSSRLALVLAFLKEEEKDGCDCGARLRPIIHACREPGHD